MSILAFQKPDKVVMLEATDFYGKFEFRPLEPGYGMTIGNALRRILLSSLEGFAISSVKIEGVDHEFSTIPGVMEDVTEIILQLKQVRFKQQIEDVNHENVSVVISGQQEFRAGDIGKFLSGFKILNPDLLICRMEPSVTLKMDLSFKIEDLRSRILLTLGFILIYRLGAHIVLPGVNPNELSALSKQTSEGVLSLLDMFSGGAFSNASIFALGIMPYISASIVVQLLGIAVPYFQRLQREGESGRKKINQITRFLTIAILLIQAPSYIANLRAQLIHTPGAIVDGGLFFTISSTIILTAGTMFILWLGERITDKGVGNGISLLIMVGIIARLPYALAGECVTRFEQAGGGLLVLLIELVVLFIVFVLAIALVQAVRKIPVQYAKRVVGNKQYGGVRQYIPLKVNAAGVMPIIFAQALMFLPIMFAGFSSEGGGSFIAAFADYTGWFRLLQSAKKSKV